MLSPGQISAFLADGYVALPGAVPAGLARACQDVVWSELGQRGVRRDDPATWTAPVVRIACPEGGPFAEAGTRPAVQAACDQLIGPGRWRRRAGVGGTIPVRFPSEADPGDAGWHIDSSFPPEGAPTNNYFDWRINVRSKGRALLMLFLFSEIGERDAPTRIRVGSHFDIARRLAPAGERGLSLRELAGQGFDDSTKRKEVLATGEAGTVYLCHPFLVHAAQPHRGTRPRLLAQPALETAQPFSLDRPDGAYSPVEEAIRIGLGLREHCILRVEK